MSLRSKHDLFLAVKNTCTNDGQVKTLSTLGCNRVYIKTHELAHMDLSYKPLMVRPRGSRPAGPSSRVHDNFVNAHFTSLSKSSYQKGTNNSDTGGVPLRVRSTKT